MADHPARRFVQAGATVMGTIMFVGGYIQQVLDARTWGIPHVVWQGFGLSMLLAVCFVAVNKARREVEAKGSELALATASRDAAQAAQSLASTQAAVSAQKSSEARDALAQATESVNLSSRVATVLLKISKDCSRANAWKNNSMSPPSAGEWIPDAARARYVEAKKAVEGSIWRDYPFQIFPEGIAHNNPVLITYLEDLKEAIAKLEVKIDARRP